MSAISQTYSFNKIYDFIERYDTRIKKIRVFGKSDKNGNCKEPYFLLDDVLKYLNMLNRYVVEIDNFTDKEILKKDLIIGSKINHECIVITKYGLIRCISLCSPKSNIIFRYFVYGIIDCISNIDNTNTDDAFIINALDSFINESNSEIQKDIELLDSNKKHIVYFITNKYTNNVNIGYSNNIKETINILQLGTDCELKIFKILECETYKESYKIIDSIQSFFHRSHIHGQWYNITEEMINAYCF